MANVLVTTSCPHGCAFCFASRLTEVAGAEPISMQTFDRVLDSIENAGGEEVRLVGGEPTVHPAFHDLVAAAVERGFRVTILTGGFFNRAAEETLLGVPESKVTVVFNLNAALAHAEVHDLAETIDRISPRAALAFTVDRIPFVLDGLEDLVGLNTLRQPVRVRVGLAHPEGTAENRWIRPSRYPAVGRYVAELARRLRRLGARLELDCGFVRCAFDDEAMAALREAEALLRFECRPIVDIGPDGRAVHCLALGTRFSSPADQSMPALRESMLASREGFDEVGVFPECPDCGWRASGECDGGCLSVRLRRFQWFTIPEAAS